MNIPYVFKKCTKCGETLPATIEYFHKQKTGKYGLRGECKKCSSEQRKQRYENNRDEEKERSKKYYENNKDKKAERDKQYYKNNKDKRTEQQKQWRENNKDKKAEYNKQYYATPQGQVVSINNRCKRRIKEQNQGNGITKAQWLECMEYFEWKCAYSGEYIGGKNNQSIRSIDHVKSLNQGGKHEIWNLVPMYKPYNSGKKDKDMEEWYQQQDFYSEERLQKIYEWQEYAFNKYGK